MFTHKAWTQLAFEIKCLLVGPAWEKLATAGNNKKNAKNDRWLTTPPVTTHFPILDIVRRQGVVAAILLRGFQLGDPMHDGKGITKGFRGILLVRPASVKMPSIPMFEYPPHCFPG